MPTLKRLVPTLFTVLIGALGVLAVLFAWHLPPFTSDAAVTENAYVRGSVTTISPQLAGYVAAVPARDFATVHKGDVLVQLDDRQYRERLAQAEAALATAKATVAKNEQAILSATAALEARRSAAESAQAAVDNADANWTRVSALQDRGVITNRDAETAELTRQQAQSALDAAQSQIAVAQDDLNAARINRESLQAGIASAAAAVEMAQIDLDNTVVRAPADGKLGQVSVTPGQFVGAGSAMLSLVGEQVWVIANFKETELSGMALGQPVTLTVDALHDASFTGRIAEFSPATASEFSLLSGSNATGNFTKIAQRLPVRIELDADQDRGADLAPGLSVRVSVAKTPAA